MDLKELKKGKLWILHLIDSATRYTAAAIIHSKNKNLVVRRIFQIWIAYFGAPKKFHSDCGGEFCNDIFREMNEKLGIETSTTPGEAPFSNGIVERSNKVLYEAMMKTQEETKCNFETALAWSVSAKNGLQNVLGYSPNQLVLGSNINLPSVLTDNLPAHEIPQSEIVRQKLSALHNSRKNFIAAESSERIKRALRHPVRTYSEQIYEPGEKVYYKRKDYKGWKGPAKVLGKKGNFVLIRHGNAFYRCHPCHVMKVHSQGGNDSNRDHSEVGPSKAQTCVNSGDAKQQYEDKDEDLHLEGHDNEVQIHSTKEAQDIEDNEILIQDNEDNGNEPENDNDDDAEGAELMKSKSDRPQPRMMIEYMLKDGTQCQGTVMKQQPKARSTYRDWINIEDVKGNKGSVNWQDVEWWRANESEQVLLLKIKP